MTLEQSIKDTFIRFMKTRSIDEIDVSLICKTLNITRQAFYYHYKNIYDVVLSIYEPKEIILEEENDEVDIVTRFINYLYREEKFNRDIADSSCADILKDFGISYFYASFADFYGRKGLNVDDKIEISWILAYALSEEIIRLFKNENYRKQDVEDKIFRYFDYTFFKNLLTKYK